MTTIINNPGNGDAGRETSGERSNVALMLILLLLIVAGILFYFYGLPSVQDRGEVNVTIPDTVDVNVRTPDTNTGGTGGSGEGG